MKISEFRRKISDEDPGASVKPAVRHRRGHFRFNTVSALTILLFLAIALGSHGVVSAGSDPIVMVYLAAGTMTIAVLLFLMPFWPTALVAVAAIWAGPTALGVPMPLVSSILTLGFIVAPGFEIVAQWDKIVILRLGRFHRVKGPGVVFLIPMIDTIAGYVDTRIRVTDFSAEKSLTLDTVPVHVDALAFWMIWDAEKAVLEVQDFHDAVVLSAQTALRSNIGANTLTALLSERERMAREIQNMVDAKTNPWGITIISVEFKEILVPKELEDALSREAQAERERKSRKILGSAEAEIAASYAKAADRYRNDPTALQLRAMNMIYESIRNKGGLVLTPASALETMNLGTVLGSAAYGDVAGIIPGVIPADGLKRDADPQAEDTGNSIEEINENEKKLPDGEEGVKG